MYVAVTNAATKTIDLLQLIPDGDFSMAFRPEKDMAATACPIFEKLQSEKDPRSRHRCRREAK